MNWDSKNNARSVIGRLFNEVRAKHRKANSFFQGAIGFSALYYIEHFVFVMFFRFIRVDAVVVFNVVFCKIRSRFPERRMLFFAA